MTVDTWLEFATTDALKRGLPELRPVLQSLAEAMSTLRKADWNVDAATARMPPP